MSNKIDLKAQEGSTFIVTLSFYVKKSDGTPLDPVVPNADLTWTLKDEDGGVVNNKSNVPLAPNQTVTVVLSGDDLALIGDYPEKRFLTIKGTFDSIYGSNLPLVDETVFQVENLLGEP